MRLSVDHRRVVVLAAIALAVAALTGARAGAARSSMQAPCTSKDYTALCKGTATVRVGSTSTRYSAVTCYISKKGYSLEVFKSGGFVLKVVDGRRTTKPQAGTIFVTTKAGVAPVDIKVKLRPGWRSGTFSGKTVPGKTLVSGSFLCK